MDILYKYTLASLLCIVIILRLVQYYLYILNMFLGLYILGTWISILTVVQYVYEGEDSQDTHIIWGP
jgi:hypothetical protein